MTPESPSTPPETVDHAARPADRRDRHVYVLWAVGLASLLALGAVCWELVIPVWQVHKRASTYEGVSRYWGNRQERRDWYRAEIGGLGGPEAAVPKVMLYLWVRRISGRGSWTAVQILGGCGLRAVPHLTSLLGDADERVRLAATEALGDVEGPEATAALLKAMDDFSGNVRQRAIEKLLIIEAPREIFAPKVIPACCDAHSMVRVKAVYAIRSFLREENLPAQPPVAAIYHTMDWYDGQRVLLLELLLKDNDAAIRRAAAETLRKLKTTEGPP